MNTEQLHAEFEAAMDGLRFDRSDDGTYTSSVTRVALEAYQAGRVALQSQDREDADLKEALLLALEYWADRQQRYKNRSPVWVQKARAALGIDHARRVEGDEE